MTKVLLIDNDKKLIEMLKDSLEEEGYQVCTAENNQLGLKVAWQESPDVVIMDLIMPISESFEMSRRLRELEVQCILVMSDRQDERSVVKALEMEADDYLYKPIAVPILLAKIRTLMRRTNKHNLSHSIYNDGRLLIDLDRRTVEMEGKPIKLTPTEFRLLSLLLRQVGRVVPHEELIQGVWGAEKNAGLGSLKLYIHYLRQKIEDSPRQPYYLLAEWGIGYRLREPKIDLIA